MVSVSSKLVTALNLVIAVTNLFNRLNATTRQVAGAWGDTCQCPPQGG